MKIKLPRLVKKIKIDFHLPIIAILALILVTLGFVFTKNTNNLKYQLFEKNSEAEEVGLELDKIKKEIDELKNQDQYVRNEELEEKINNIENSYNQSVSVYEKMLDLKEKSDDTNEIDELFSKNLKLLSERNYQDAQKTLDEIESKISEQEKEIAQSFTIPEKVIVQNTPPGAGYSRQQVQTEVGIFMVSIVAADISSTKIIVDTASDSDCSDNCPVLPLSDYVSRNNAFAGVNGTYFCPSTYPSCVGKSNSFDLLLMNKNKTYFNSDNNVYSNNPAVIFGDGYIRFVTSASQWGRDTSPSGVISNYPLLVFNSEVSFGGDDDPKKGSKGARSFVANKGNTIYIGVVHNATVAESARVMKTLGMENALNLDNGGSTALWSSGYKVGPGRNLPNVVLFVRK